MTALARLAVSAGVKALERLAEDGVAALLNAVLRAAAAAEDCFLLQVEFHIIFWTRFLRTRLLNWIQLLNWTQLRKYFVNNGNSSSCIEVVFCSVRT